MAIYIHAVMEDANDFDPFGGLPIKDEMSSHMVFAISFPDVVKSTAHAGFPRQGMESLIQLCKIPVPLLTAPSFLGVTAYGFQIGFGL